MGVEDFLVREVDGYVEGKYGVHKIKEWNQWNVTDLYSGLSIAKQNIKRRSALHGLIMLVE